MRIREPISDNRSEQPIDTIVAVGSANLSEIDLGCVDLIDLFRVGSKDQSLH